MDNKVHVQVLEKRPATLGIPIYNQEKGWGELRDLAILWEGETAKVTAIEKYAKGVHEHIPVEQVEDVQLMGVKLKGSWEAEQLVP